MHHLSASASSMLSLPATYCNVNRSVYCSCGVCSCGLFVWVGHSCQTPVICTRSCESDTLSDAFDLCSFVWSDIPVRRLCLCCWKHSASPLHFRRDQHGIA